MKKELRYEELTLEGKEAYLREKRSLVFAYKYEGKRKPNPYSENVRRIELEAWDEYMTQKYNKERRN